MLINPGASASSATRIVSTLNPLPVEDAATLDEPGTVRRGGLIETVSPDPFAGEANTMTGGPGDDTYNVDNVGDVIVEAPGGGTDSVYSAVDYTLGANVENLYLVGGASNATGNSGNNILRGNTGSNYTNGNNLYGMDGNDTLYGEGGNDALYGGEGNDRLDGGEGFDTMTGGNGDDVYVIDNDRDTVIEAVGGGIDTIEVAANFSLTERGKNVENLILTAGVLATGNALNNTLIGNAGGNILDGLVGADRMEGGLGDDMYWVDNAGDTVIEAAGGGIDTVIVRTATFVLAAGQEIEKILSRPANTGLSGIAVNMTGNEFANYIEGNNNDNVLDGGGGNDTLIGWAGRDTLRGGEGNDYLDGVYDADTMIGGIGDDVYGVDDAGDIVTEYAGEGTDRVESAISYTLGANVENLTLLLTGAIDGTGNELNNVLIGNSGANFLRGNGGDDTLYGGGGSDSFAGGTGNDTYYVDGIGDTVYESFGEGTDTVFSSGTFSLAGAYLENLTLTGTANINGTGTGYANVLTGNSGNNILDGGGGADSMIGGLGDDIYVVDQTGDVITELAGQGNDTVRSSISFALGASNVENLELTGTAAINGIGNAANNWMIGNSGNNTLNGGGGNDILDGGAGNDTLRGNLGDDTYYVEGQNDTIYESSDEGTDTVISTGTFSMAGIYVENLTLAGTANIDGTGTGYANTIIGNSGANRIDGGGGNDSLYGGLGNDILIGGAGQDGFYFDTAAGASNWDDLQGFSHAEDSIYLDRDVFTGIGADGQLAAGAFRAGALAVDADDRILYDSATGNIYYDADGVGGADAVLLAHVAGGTTVDNTDFFGF